MQKEVFRELHIIIYRLFESEFNENTVIRVGIYE